ncbi:DEAD/DEAH box helicase [Agromyces larvae]|uniref:DEAD/DEAH box helicase n=1 Tax=Agromyces larvae TaxID=2929802 RepID=A0ABY4BUS7_9MICO|nr:DEAD/DEAH box helicase [Agromyces larvae]UOE42968.1 DEAD/DEAH box helicase [Agromyces larvae]
MPKNKKPAGGRPARNFDPSYARGASKSGAPKSGSRSPGHRGYRPDEDAPKKARWSRDERVASGRTPHRADARPEQGGRDGRDAGRDGRDAGRRYDRDDRAPRREFDRDRAPRDGGAPRRFDRDDRAPRREFDRAPRRFDDRGERPARREFDRDRTPRDGGAPRRDFDRDRAPRDGGAPRRFDRDDRAPRRDFDRTDRAPRRDFDRDRAPRDGGAPRRFDRDDRAPRRDFDRTDRAPRREFDRDRAPRDGGAPRRFDRDDRAPRRDFDRDDRAPRRDFDRTDRPARRDFDRDDRARAPRRFDDRGERPARREFDRDRTDRADRAPRRDVERPGFRDSERRPSSFYPARDERPAFTPEDDVVLERLAADAIQAEAVDGVSFGDLGLGQNIVRALGDLGAEHPFPIQAATIPVVLEGRDVLGRGRTGSGKTIAFGAPTVERLMQLWAAKQRDLPNGPDGRRKREMGRAPRALILAPTRELALQIDRTVQPIAQAVGLFTTQVYGGVPQARQVGALRRGVDIVIGTPGRIEDLERQGHLDLSAIEITVLDEADHMCDLGFLEPVQRILRLTKPGGQKLLFSATLDTGVATLVDEFLVDPAVHEVAGEDQSSGTIDHRVFVIENRDKRDIVAALADRDGKTLVFSRTRAFAEDLTEHLEEAGIRAVALHGDLNQSRRTRNLHQLTSGRVDVLVATDVAARGIHVDDIDLVIQADAPDEYKTYLHRAGRTGRAGRMGRVVTLIPRNRQRRMNDLLDRAEIEVDFEDVRLGDALLDDLGPVEIAAIESEEGFEADSYEADVAEELEAEADEAEVDEELASDESFEDELVVVDLLDTDGEADATEPVEASPTA